MKTIALILAALALTSCAAQQLGGPQYEPPPEVVAFQSLPLAAARSMPADYGEAGYLISWTVNCPEGSAALVTPPTANGSVAITIGQVVGDITCQNATTTPVSFGDSLITDPLLATRDAPAYCLTNCPLQQWSRPVQKAYCRSDVGTIVIQCDAAVKATDAP